MLKSIKERIRKISSAKNNVFAGIRKRIAKSANIKSAQKERKPVKPKETMGMSETTVGTSKFYTGQPQQQQRIMLHDLPDRYGMDKIVLQVRDPWWIHAYWELQEATRQRYRNELGGDFYRARLLLRVYDVSQINFNGNNAHSFFDIQINEQANNWYIDTGGPGRSWCVDLGLLLPDGRFITIIRSNTVFTPLEGPSWITDEEWMIPEDLFARLYGMGFGFGRSSPGKAWREQMKRALFSGVLASPGITSVSSPARKIPRERKFWLVVNTELIVYGATEPDATVRVQGKEVKLRPDGTFTLRFALPDGKQVIPVEAVSSDKLEERAITPIVTKETK